MYQHETEPVAPHVFVEQTRRELTKLLKQHDPVWAYKLKNFIELQEGAAFRYGFLMGAVCSAMLATLLVLILRS
jgi:hypothetical protein